MVNVGVVCFFASYLLALLFDWLRLAGRGPGWRWWMLGCGTAGFVAETIYLWNRHQLTHLPPLLSSTHDWLLVLTWTVVLVQLFVALFAHDWAVGIIVWPLVELLIAGWWLIPNDPGQPALNAPRSWMMLHVSVLLFGIATVLMSLILSLSYLWQHRRLKQRQSMADGMQLPSLDRLERWNRWTILLSVPLLTIGVVTGFGLSVAKRPDYQLRWVDPVTLGGLLSLAMMIGLLLWVVRRERPAGRQVATRTAWACGFLLVMLVGLQLLTSWAQLTSPHAPKKTAAGQLWRASRAVTLAVGTPLDQGGCS